METTVRPIRTTPTTSATDAAWPSAMGGNALNTARRLRSWSPSATANSQPMAGLMPWYAPSAASVIQGHRSPKLMTCAAQLSR